MKLSRPRTYTLLRALCCLWLACTVTPAQTSIPPTQSSAQTTQPSAPPVRLNVIVTDEKNGLVTDLRQEDFRVEEDGVPQTITHFAKEESPVSYAIVVDNSGSLRNVLDYMLRAGGTLVSGHKPGDETMLVRFVGSDNISVVQDFTGDQSALMQGLSSMYVEGGQTAVLDAVYMSAEHVGERRRDEDGRRRALILLTDGEDRSSFYKLSELQKLLRKLDVQVFAVGVVTNLPKQQGFIGKSPQEKARTLLNTLTQETGGRAFYPKNVKELQDAVDSITRELRAQYVITYQPANASRDGKFRKVQVKLNESATGGAKRSVHTRSGYFAPGAQATEKTQSKEKSPRLKSP